MLARTLLDEHYHDCAKLTLAIADALAAQMSDLSCTCVQVDEANIPGNPSDGPLAAEAINHVLDAVRVEKAVHFCFGNYGGQTIQKGDWTALISFLNRLRADHLVLQLAHRPPPDLDPLQGVNAAIGSRLGLGDLQSNHLQ